MKLGSKFNFKLKFLWLPIKGTITVAGTNQAARDKRLTPKHFAPFIVCICEKSNI